MKAIHSRRGGKFIRSRVWPLATVLLLFLAWMGSLSVILGKAKVGETMKVNGRFTLCDPCDDLDLREMTPLCFSGRVSEGNVSASRSEVFVFSVKDDERTERDETLQVTVGNWSAGLTHLSLCVATADADEAAALIRENDQGFTITVRRESLLSALWRQQ